ncbi:MAG: nickel pincer cofactor biosynthesis protein LarC [Acidimicrobiia bacterium]|nr:nickel pincer cofactor biosynthesis protein LarC [Acidimicrobiia bacterium]
MTPARCVWFNCGVGVAGDMLLGALIDAGADTDEVAGTIAGVGVGGYALTFERVHRRSLAAMWANVVTKHGHDHRHDHDGQAGHEHQPHRSLGEILQLLAAADMPERVRARATAVFTELGRAEGAVHDIDPADVELHEVGALDAIVDVVGVCAALESLAIDHIGSSAIGIGHGTVATAHGILTHPAPAVVRMLADHRVPLAGMNTSLETATPTGVAVLVALAEHFGPPPAMRATAVGYGAGTADPLDRPNVVTALVGTPEGSAPDGPGPSAVVIDTNVDDVSGEVLAHTIAVLLDLGALDAWASPIIMKKGRPAHTVSVLAAPADEIRLQAALVAETGTLGTRSTVVSRAPQRRTDSTVTLDGHELRVKRTGGRVKVEYDDAVVASAALGVPLRDVLRRAEQLGGDPCP